MEKYFFFPNRLCYQDLPRITTLGEFSIHKECTRTHKGKRSFFPRPVWTTETTRSHNRAWSERIPTAPARPPRARNRRCQPDAPRRTRRNPTNGQPGGATLPSSPAYITAPRRTVLPHLPIAASLLRLPACLRASLYSLERSHAASQDLVRPPPALSADGRSQDEARRRRRHGRRARRVRRGPGGPGARAHLRRRRRGAPRRGVARRRRLRLPLLLDLP